jgi:hypothetical protein
MKDNGHPRAPFHGICFHRTSQQHSALVAAFLVGGITKGQPALVVSNAGRRDAIFDRLSAGVDVAALERAGMLTSWDADEALNRLGSNGRIDTDTLQRDTSHTVHVMSQGGARTVRIYGELAGLLWQRKLRMQVTEVEVYASRLTAGQNVLAICGYDERPFLADRGAAAHVCGFHTHVLAERWDETLISRAIDPSA